MLVCNPSIVVVLLCIALQVSSQNYYNPSITCYMTYEHEETKSPTSDAVLGYSYDQSEITQYSSPDGQSCAAAGCVCFSYRGTCSHTSPGSNHFSKCTDTDRQQRATKWHRGWTSISKCEQMRQQPQTYLNLTCCYADRCNDQPGKITKISDTKIFAPHPQSLSTSYVPDSSRTSPSYQKSFSSNAAFLSSSSSGWMIIFPLLCVGYAH